MGFGYAVVPSLLGLLVAASVSTPSQAAEKRPIVIELFTSQGCSSCPPANANLIELGRRKEVLTLSYSVTYWDYLGWKDIFGKQEFTDRQVTYEPALGQRGPFTPQMVINGRISIVGMALSEVEGALADAPAADGPEVMLSHGSITIGQGEAPADGADVWLVRYNPELVNVPVARGENKGRTLPHSHVVHDLIHLGSWHGKDAKLALPPRSERCAMQFCCRCAMAVPFLRPSPTDGSISQAERRQPRYVAAAAHHDPETANMFRRAFLKAAACAILATGIPPTARAADGEIAGFDEAVKAGRPILIHVTAEWCPICHRQKPIVSDLLSKPEFKAIRKFEIDFDTQKDVLRRYQIQQQSTMIVFRNGEEVDRQAGQTDAAVIEALLREAL